MRTGREEGKKRQQSKMNEHRFCVGESRVRWEVQGPSLQLVRPILIRPRFVSGHGPMQSLQVTLSTPYYNTSNPL